MNNKPSGFHFKFLFRENIGINQSLRRRGIMKSCGVLTVDKILSGDVFFYFTGGIFSFQFYVLYFVTVISNDWPEYKTRILF